MKRFLLISLVVLLSLSAMLLWGCAPKEAAAPTLYWNADRGTERTAEADGSYQALFLVDGQQVTVRVPNQETMDLIDKQEALSLVLDENNTVTQVLILADMPQYYLAYDYTIQSFGGNTLKLNSEQSLNGKEVVLTLEESTKILDVSPFATTKGEDTVLQKGDGATVVANADGSIAGVFINERQGIFTTTKRYCPICEKDVEFTNWFSNASMPFVPGHYFLEKDIEMTATTSMGTGEITLDLNGKTVKMVNEGQRFYVLGEQAILNVVDTVGNGRAIVASGGNGPYKAGMFVRMNGDGCEFNLYSGTLDATDAVCDYGCIVDNYNGVFNMYGGTLLGGTTYGVGGGAVIVQKLVNIYGGEIIGGYCADLNGYKNNPPGGGCIRHNGATTLLNIYGGTITGGKTDYNGGCLFINGPTNIYGGTITGGSATLAGGGIYCSLTADLTISGDVVITDNENGNIYLSGNRKITIGEAGLGDATLNIDMQEKGVFTNNAVPEDKLSCFLSTSGKISRNADGTLSLK